MTGHDPDLKPELKKDLDASLQARKELGADYEAELVDSFLEKVEHKLDGAMERRLRRQAAEQRMTAARGGRPDGGGEFGTFGERFGFAVVTLVLAIPLSAIGAANAGLSGLLVTWAGIVGVNAVQVMRGWPWQRNHDRGGSEWD
ncbi:hypothetical protein [Streptomyces huiliensis]|uniref:hypothetical protein n=1 Tax=Streptomyces huiliensis TaxID=2876027 RepID=UPI001CBE7C9E|nr:hypothetical protein [Streptomyces huiliensis]MBZ4319058.1 hypothetical protein [Streptomyces huiliensis]